MHVCAYWIYKSNENKVKELGILSGKFILGKFFTSFVNNEDIGN